MYASGIIYRADKITDMAGSWNDMGNPSADGRAYLLDDFQEVIGAGNLVNGAELNSTDEADVEKAKEWALDLKPKLRGFSTDDVQNMVSGNAWIHHGWNGDVVNVRNQVDKPENFTFQKCNEGIPLGTDCFAIPANAEHPGTALTFINFILDPENASKNIEYMGYPMPYTGARRDVRRPGQGRPVDQRDRRRPRERPAVRDLGVQGRRALGSDVDGDQGGLSGALRGPRADPRRPVAAVFFAAPFALVVAVSFGTPPSSAARIYGWYPENYSRVFDPLFLPVLLRSVGYALATVVLCLLLGYPVAYYIARFGGRRKQILIALVVVPFFVNYLIRTYAWVALLSDEGVVNGLLGESIRFLNTPWAVILGLVYGYLAFMILPVYAALDRMDPALIEAGKDLYGTRLADVPCTSRGRPRSRACWPARCSCSCPRSATSWPPSCSAGRRPTWSAT